METPVFKYEMNQAVVQYLQQAVASLNGNTEDHARNKIAVLDILRTPKNAEELEKQTLESLKSKYEPISEDKKEVSKK